MQGGGIVKEKVCAGLAQDISQISGPDGKSRPTPLSQSGFRDPASVGGGQQLTLLSIEVLVNIRLGFFLKFFFFKFDIFVKLNVRFFFLF
jgi:hypothetical protein